MPEINKKTLQRIFLFVCGAIVLYWLLHETDRVKGAIATVSNIFAPFVFGGVLAFILNVPMRAIENGLLQKVKKDKLKRVIAVVLTLLALLLVIALVFWLLIPQIILTVNSLVPTLSDFLTKAEAWAMDFLSEHPQLLAWVEKNTNLEELGWAAMAEKLFSVIGTRMSSILGGAVSAISSIFSGVFNAVIALVFSVYCLSQKETLARQGRKLAYAFLKEKVADNIVKILRLTNTSFSNFLSGQCVEVCILGGMYAVGMAVLGMPYIPLITVVIALTAFIPIVGAWTGCVVGTFLIFVKDPMLAIVFVAMFLVIQLVENNMIYPRVVGNSVGLSGMWVLVAITIGGELMGIFGMFLMIPLVSVVYTIVREYTNKKLASMPLDSEKLQLQPPELRSKFKEKRESKKKARILKKLERKKAEETK